MQLITSLLFPVMSFRCLFSHATTTILISPMNSELLLHYPCTIHSTAGPLESEFHTNCP